MLAVRRHIFTLVMSIPPDKHGHGMGQCRQVLVRMDFETRLQNSQTCRNMTNPGILSETFGESDRRLSLEHILQQHHDSMSPAPQATLTESLRMAVKVTVEPIALAAKLTIAYSVGTNSQQHSSRHIKLSLCTTWHSHKFCFLVGWGLLIFTVA